MKDDDFKDVQDWISLKKYENPKDGYFDDFLIEVQRRRIAESERLNLFQTIQSKLTNFTQFRVAYATSAVAAIAVAVLVIKSGLDQKATAESAIELQAEIAALNISTEYAVDDMPHMQRLDFTVSPAPLKVRHQQVF